MSKFKVGEHIVCINDKGYSKPKKLVYGKTYIVLESRNGHTTIDDSDFAFRDDRFIKLSEFRREKIISLYE